jgi:hypothetical protein
MAYQVDWYKRKEGEVPFDEYVKVLSEGGKVDVGKILVISPWYHCFGNWCRKVGISKNNPVFKYISDGQQLQGWNPSDVFILDLCGWEWRNASALSTDVLQALQYLRRLGVESRSDECIVNGRKLARERDRAYARERERRLLEQDQGRIIE